MTVEKILTYIMFLLPGPKHSLRKSYLLILSSVLVAASFAIGLYIIYNIHIPGVRFVFNAVALC